MRSASVPRLEAVKSVTPLALLRKVRDVMNTAARPQTRLDKLVRVIAWGLQSQVCSIYLARGGDIFELAASEGLNKEAVHATKLESGEGLVGEVAAMAQPLNLADAQSHEKFAFRPETGEEQFSSFVGVPILYSHKVIGVLVVQSTDAKIYSDEQIEILQTVAMVLAEVAVSNQLVDLNEITGKKDELLLSQYYTGAKLSAGLAKAVAVLHRPRIDIDKLVADDPDAEELRLSRAIVELQASVDALLERSAVANNDTKREIMETYRMFTQDKGWLDNMNEAIRSGLTAEAAVKKVQEQMHARMAKQSSLYIKERIQDLDDLSLRLLYHLAGKTSTAAQTELPEQFILIARSLGPAELLEYDHEKLKGVIVEEGSASSHIAIIARMMDIPMVGGVQEVSSLVQSGDVAIVDGDHGEVYIRPPEDVEQAIDEHIEHRRARDARYAASRDLPAVTRDGHTISLNLNIGLYLDANQLDRPDVDGVGLYRTELPYLASSDIPDVEEQKKIYGEVLRHAKGKRVIFRSFDIGGDKQVPYVKIGAEENPAMGWRATRIGLDRPVILRRQFRGLIRAAAGQELHVMFPFIAEVSEFDATKALFDRELERAKVEGQVLPKAVKVGSMLEIPSLLYQLPALLKRVDFVSIGSNDLLQFLFACDRGSARMSSRYDRLSPVVMNIVSEIVERCTEAEVDVGFCGDMANKPIEAMALLGCGVRCISVPPPAVGPVKAMIRSLNVKELSEYMEYLRSLSDHSIRNQLEQFARDHGVDIE